MLNEAILLLIFTLKAIILVVLFLLLIVGIIAIISNSKEKLHNRISIKNLNKKYLEIKENLFKEILSKKQFKKFLKDKKHSEKHAKEESDDKKNIFILNFHGDIKATAVSSLSEEVTAILSIAKPKDEVVVCVESGGGMVHAYGLAAAQLQRFRQQNIPLTVIVDKIAASGGYLMASIADKILAAPFAIIGSIGVIVQLPNFHRLLKEKNVDFEQLTAGNFKRTLTMFGHNTEEGREKLQEEIEDIHQLFMKVIKDHRQQVDLDKVATGEHWLGTQALELKLVDDISTSDDYLFKQSNDANLYSICYQQKKSFMNKIFAGANLLKSKIYEKSIIQSL